jgi:phenylalanyl-tRNA synthetase alpha chain
MSTTEPGAPSSTLPPMIDDIAQAQVRALERVGAVTDLDDLRAASAELLGKKGALAGLKQRLGALDADERRSAGQALNDALAAIGIALEGRRTDLQRAEHTRRLAEERLDLTESTHRPTRGHAHIVTQAMARLVDVFVGLGFEVAEGPEVESDFYNFTALNMPPAHPARSMWDTLFVELGEPGSVVLRTHTSPVQIRVMQEHAPPLYRIMPGRVFRQDTPDATHMPVFHQLEGLVVDRGITFADLAGTIDMFTKAFFGAEFGSRLRPSYFPFTEPSAEFDIQRPDGSWLELGGCGMVHPNVFNAVGLDPEEWSGFAFGFGIDRLGASRYGVDDLRELFTNDIRVLRQF